MPRKRNGFGNFGNSGFKGIESNTKRGKGTTSFGNYPSNRRFGTTVQRTAIEQYDLDSTWARWRRGMEYYYQAAYLNFEETNAVLYQGTDFEVPVTFDGYRFATKNADSRTHYAIHRTIDQNKFLGFITEIQSDQSLYQEQYFNREIWTKIIASRDINSDAILLRSVGERVGDGNTSANISWILTSKKRPAIYQGKSLPEGNNIVVSIPLDEIRDTEFIENNNGNLQSLVGEVVYMPDFFIDRPVSLFDRFTDSNEFWTVDITEFPTDRRLTILNNTLSNAPLLSDVSDLNSIYTTSSTIGSVQGSFIYKKDIYQRFFGQQYLTADLVKSEIDSLSYAIQPWTIQSIKVNENANRLELTSEPFQASLQLYTPSESERWVVFSDNSFTYTEPDYDSNGDYNHTLGIPGEKEWQKIRLDIDPWQDQIFTAGKALTFADLYTCSCPAYLHAIIRSPEAYDEQGKKMNRQQRAPMPTAKGTNDYDLVGVGRAAGIAQSWATRDYRKGFKVCKHTIASMFINKIRVQEPNTFPSVDTRERFEAKLAADIKEVADEFNAQLKRSEMTTVEIIYALAEALNLDDIELGYVLLTSNF